MNRFTLQMTGTINLTILDFYHDDIFTNTRTIVTHKIFFNFKTSNEYIFNANIYTKPFQNHVDEYECRSETITLILYMQIPTPKTCFKSK